MDPLAIFAVACGASLIGGVARNIRDTVKAYATDNTQAVGLKGKLDQNLQAGRFQHPQKAQEGPFPGLQQLFPGA